MSTVHVRPGFWPDVECRAIAGLIAGYVGGGVRGACIRDDRTRTEVAARSLAADGFPGAAGVLARLAAAIQAEAVAALGWEGPLHPEFLLLQANHPGDGHPRHADNARLDPATGRWVPNHTPQRAVSTVLYLNAHGADFDGGELVFPARGLSIEPAPGLLVAFASDGSNEHLVATVGRGTRYSALLWFTADESRREVLA